MKIVSCGKCIEQPLWPIIEETFMHTKHMNHNKYVASKKNKQPRFRVGERNIKRNEGFCAIKDISSLIKLQFSSNIIMLQ